MINLILKSLGLKSIIKLVVGFINDYEDFIIDNIPNKDARKIIDDFTDLLEDLTKII